VPIAESLDWNHGVFMGATIESETTAATLGAVGQRKSSPMANMDFVIVPLSRYISNHLKFGNKLRIKPKVYATNYFLKGENGQYLNGKLDKRVWILWAEGRVHNEFAAIRTPIGYIPKYVDLANLFRSVFNGREYTREEYETQFGIRVINYLDKFSRMEEQYLSEAGMPEEFWTCLRERRNELVKLHKEFNKDNISPFDIQE
jgi:phosphoenolpyruvate carboxykinase (GTP)